jgi:hypothetical protein
LIITDPQNIAIPAPKRTASPAAIPTPSISAALPVINTVPFEVAAAAVVLICTPDNESEVDKLTPNVIVIAFITAVDEAKTLSTTTLCKLSKLLKKLRGELSNWPSALLICASPSVPVGLRALSHLDEGA